MPQPHVITSQTTSETKRGATNPVKTVATGLLTQQHGGNGLIGWAATFACLDAESFVIEFARARYVYIGNRMTTIDSHRLSLSFFRRIALHPLARTFFSHNITSILDK